MNNTILKLKEMYFQITNKEYQFNLSDNLTNDLGMSSVVFVYFMLLIEEEFNIDIYNLSYHQFETVADLANYIEKQSKSQL